MYHLEAWNQIIMNSKPPVPETPLSPFIPLTLMMEHGAALNCEKIKTVCWMFTHSLSVPPWAYLYGMN
jgi:hypothetical protein